MIIQIENIHARVMQASEDERSWLADYLSFPDQKAKFRRAPVWKRGDGKIHMLSDVASTFPAGFIEVVKKAAAEEKHTVRVVDKRRRPVTAAKIPMLDWLRDYQADAIAIAQKTERGVFHHTTGAGKTELMVALAEVYDCPWLILTHSKDLLAQTQARFAERTGEEVGQIGDGVFNPKRVTAATFQTLFKRLKKRDAKLIKFMAGIRGVMVDECHVVAADTFWRVVMSLSGAYYRYGFSGTPFARSDKKSIYTWGAIGPIIHRISAELLQQKGVLAKPKIKMLPVSHPRQDGSWIEVYAETIVESKQRNAVVVYAAEQLATKPCLLFVNHVKHGKILEDILQRRGVKVEFVWGKAKLPMRQAAIRRLVHGDVDVLICNVIFQEGIDIPELQSVVIAQGGKSVIAALQRVGRGTRRKSKSGKVTKEEFEVFDIADRGCGCKSALKHMSCKWIEKHTRGRRNAYASEKYAVVEDAGSAQLALKRIT